MAVSNRQHVWLGDEDLGVFDEGKFSLNDAFQVIGSSGLNTKAFFEGINGMDPLALQTFVWWLRVKAGRPCDRAAIDFVLGDLKLVVESDPTVASSGSDVAATSDSSPASAI